MQEITLTALKTTSTKAFRFRFVGLSLVALVFALGASSSQASPIVVWSGPKPAATVWDGISAPRFINGDTRAQRAMRVNESPQVPRTTGYLTHVQARGLRWEQSSLSATTTTVLRFGARKLELLESEPPPNHSETMAVSQEEVATTLESNETTQELMPTEASLSISDSLAQQSEPEPVKQRSIIDEQFVNWVTRRIGDSKVEVPFQLPTENNVETAAPTERVRVRYRVEP